MEAHTAEDIRPVYVILKWSIDTYTQTHTQTHTHTHIADVHSHARNTVKVKY